jgi:hypothetical protein
VHFEAVPRDEATNNAVIFFAFAADYADLVTDDRHAPRLARRALFFDERPLTRVESVETIRLDRSYPEFVTVERKRLRARRRRR